MREICKMYCTSNEILIPLHLIPRVIHVGELLRRPSRPCLTTVLRIIGNCSTAAVPPARYARHGQPMLVPVSQRHWVSA